MKNNSHFKKIVIFLALVVIGFFGVYYLIYNDIKLRNEHTVTLQEKLLIQSDKTGYLFSTSRIIKSIEPDISRINDSIISKDGDVQFIETLDDMAKSDGLLTSTDSLAFVEDTENASSTATTFNISKKVEGSWRGVYTFLNQLESLPYKIKINKFVIVGSGEDTGTSAKKSSTKKVWRASFEITVLKYK